MKNRLLKICGKAAAFLTTFVVIACGTEHRSKPDREPLDPLTEKAKLYASLLPSVQDDYGFVDTYQCNSLQRAGLICAASTVGLGGKPVLLRAAEDEATPGRFYRRPTAYPECHAAGESRSTISADDLLGAFWCAYQTKDLAVLERLWVYGQRRDWFMGDDRIGGLHTVLRPHQVAALATTIFYLGGRDHHERKYHPINWGDCEGYVCALQVYEILLRGEIEGGITTADRNALKHAAERQLRNPLTQYAWHLYSDGNQSTTRELLLDDPRWPADKLPSTDTVCDPWSVQRDDDSEGLLPCPEQGKIHSGGDFLYIVSLLTRNQGFGAAYWVSPIDQWRVTHGRHQGNTRSN